MLKTIRVEQLQLGMHLHSLCGPWLDHPFWKSQFVLRDPQDLAKLRAGGVTACRIDTEKGADIAPGIDRAQPAGGADDALVTGTPAARAPSAAARRTSLEDECGQGAMLCAKAQKTVAALFNEARMGRVLRVEGCAPIVDEISASVRRNAAALLGLVRLKAHDDYTFMHSVAVCTLMVALAQKMGQDDAQVREAGLAGMLHDIGKAKIPLAVLNKPGKLTDPEYEVMKQHSRHGHDLLLAASVTSAGALDVCLHHHERPDGTGYPGGLGGAALSLQARMGAVCDVYDAITSNRPYREGWEPAASIARMSDWARAGQFDPAVFRAFVECIGIYPIGSLVRLQSGRLAVTIEQNEASLIAPRVKVFYSTRSNMPVPIETIDLGAPGCHERIVGREANTEWRFQFLDELSVAAPAIHARRVG